MIKFILLFFVFFASCASNMTLITDSLSDVKGLKNRGDVIVSIDSVKKAGYSTVYTIKYREK